MFKEMYKSVTDEFIVSIVNNEINGVKTKMVEKNTVRIYKNGYIGVAGKLGKTSLKELENKAMEKLSYKIEYPEDPTCDTKKNVTVKSDFSDAEKFYEEVEKLLNELKAANPGFVFFDKEKLAKMNVRMENDKGLNLKYNASHMEFSFVFKHKESSNIIDGIIGYTSFHYNREAFLEYANTILKSYENKIDHFDDGKYPVIFFENSMDYKSKFWDALNGLSFGTNSSILSGKLNERLFNNNFTLYQTNSPEDNHFGPFFDVEGTVNNNFRYNLIEDGVLKAPYTSKKYAKLFDLPLTGAAGGDYDDVPKIGFADLRISPSQKNLKELIGEREAIFALISMGSSFTSNGKFGAPIQTPLLWKSGKFVGRLPELSIESDFYKMFGDDFIGVSKDALIENSDLRCIVMELAVKKNK